MDPGSAAALTDFFGLLPLAQVVHYAECASKLWLAGLPSSISALKLLRVNLGFVCAVRHSAHLTPFEICDFNGNRYTAHADC